MKKKWVAVFHAFSDNNFSCYTSSTKKEYKTRLQELAILFSKGIIIVVILNFDKSDMSINGHDASPNLPSNLIGCE